MLAIASSKTFASSPLWLYQKVTTWGSFACACESEAVLPVLEGAELHAANIVTNKEILSKHATNFFILFSSFYFLMNFIPNAQI